MFFKKKLKKSNFQKISCYDIERMKLENGDTFCCKIIQRRENSFLRNKLIVEIGKPSDYVGLPSNYFIPKKYYTYYFEGFLRVSFDSSGHHAFIINPNNEEVGIWVTDSNVVAKRIKLLLIEKVDVNSRIIIKD